MPNFKRLHRLMKLNIQRREIRSREASSQTAAAGLMEGISKIQSVTPEMLAEERKEVEHLEDVHTHHEEKVYAEKNIYDNGTFQREYYQLYYQ